MHPFSLLTLEEKFSDSTAALSRNSELTALSRNKKKRRFSVNCRDRKKIKQWKKVLGYYLRCSLSVTASKKVFFCKTILFCGQAMIFFQLLMQFYCKTTFIQYVPHIFLIKFKILYSLKCNKLKCILKVRRIRSVVSKQQKISNGVSAQCRSD